MNPSHEDDDDMPAEIDFSKGERGKFYRPGAVHHLPVYLDNEIYQYFSNLANAQGIELDSLLNDLLKKDIALIESAK